MGARESYGHFGPVRTASGPKKSKSMPKNCQVIGRPQFERPAAPIDADRGYCNQIQVRRVFLMDPLQAQLTHSNSVQLHVLKLHRSKVLHRQSLPGFGLPIAKCTGAALGKRYI